jgi:Protein of unknown function (DUF3618)
MTSSNDPDEIRAEIERTRSGLSDNVNALADSVNPAHVAGRQVDKVKGAVFGVKDKVMGGVGGGGSDSDSGSGVGSKLGSAQSAVAGAPAQLGAQARGNPLGAGLIAFGVGVVVGSLLPASAAEQQAATKVKDAATPALSDVAKQVSGNLKEPAQQAVEAVKGSATDAAGTVKDEGTSAAADVKGQAQDAKDTVAQQ